MYIDKILTKQFCMGVVLINAGKDKLQSTKNSLLLLSQEKVSVIVCIKIGDGLNKLSDLITQNDYTQWCYKSLPFCIRTNQTYRRLAIRHSKLIRKNYKGGTLTTIGLEVLLLALPEKDANELRIKIISDKLSQRAVRSIIKEMRKEA